MKYFFRGINQTLRKIYRRINQRFNPTNIQLKENGCTKIAGEEFLKPRTLGCDYHLDRSVDKHKKYFNSSYFDLFCFLVNSLKNSVTEDGYNREKKRLINLISKQHEYSSITHNISRSSLAEAAEVSIKAGGEKNVSLIDAAYCGIAESARFKAKWPDRMSGEQSVGRGPSPLVLDKTNELRQIARANQFLRETYEMEDDLNGDEMALRSSQLPKAKQRRIKILESKTFQTTLKKGRAMKNKICIVEMSKNQWEIKMKIRQSHTHGNIEIANEIMK